MSITHRIYRFGFNGSQHPPLHKLSQHPWARGWFQVAQCRPLCELQSSSASAARIPGLYPERPVSSLGAGFPDIHSSLGLEYTYGLHPDLPCTPRTSRRRSIVCVGGGQNLGICAGSALRGVDCPPMGPWQGDARREPSHGCSDPPPNSQAKEAPTDQHFSHSVACRGRISSIALDRHKGWPLSQGFCPQGPSLLDLLIQNHH